MKVESISLMLRTAEVIHRTSAGEKAVAIDKSRFFPSAYRYIEDYCTASGFEIISVTVDGGTCNYHLVKR